MQPPRPHALKRDRQAEQKQKPLTEEDSARKANLAFEAMKELRWQRMDTEAEAQARQAKREAKRAKKRSWRYRLRRAFGVRYCCPAATKDLPMYDSDVSFISVLVSWKGTVLPLVLTRGLFWFLTFSHVLFVALASDPDTAELVFGEFDYKLLTVPTSLLIFFIVFYCGQCYTRYFALYQHCVGIAGCSMIWASLVRLHLPAKRTMQWNAMRFILAAAHVEYYDITDGMSHDEWECIISRRLLSPAESESVAAYQGFKPFQLITWALLEVQSVIHHSALQRPVEEEASAEGASAGSVQCGTSPPAAPSTMERVARSTRRLAAAADGEKEAESDQLSRAISRQLFVNFAYNDFQNCAYDMRGHCSQIYATLRQPVPFAYFHLLNLMVIINLLLLSYGMTGLANPALTIICFAIVCVVFIGLRDLAVSMANPFGDDEIDFKFEKFLGSSYTTALAFLCDKHHPSGTELPKDLTNPLDDFVANASVKISSVEDAKKVREQRASKTKASLRTIVSFENAEKLAIEYAERKQREAEEAKEAAARIRRREEEKQSEAAILLQATLRGAVARRQQQSKEAASSPTSRATKSPPHASPPASPEAAAAAATGEAAAGAGAARGSVGELGMLHDFPDSPNAVAKGEDGISAAPMTPPSETNFEIRSRVRSMKREQSSVQGDVRKSKAGNSDTWI